MILFKRTPGTPLSEAEHQQRVEAAKARWRDRAGQAAAITAGAAVGAAAGRSSSRVVMQQVKSVASTKKKPRMGEMGDRRFQSWVNRRREKIEAAVKTREKNISKPFRVPAETEKPGDVLSPVTRRVRQLRRILGSAPREIADISGKLTQNETDWHLSGAQERALVARRNELIARAEPLAAEMKHLQDAEPPWRGSRKAFVATRRADTFTRTVPPKAKPTAFSKPKPTIQEVRPTQDKSWMVRPARPRYPGSISAKGMKALRDNLRDQAKDTGLRAAAHARQMGTIVKPRLQAELLSRYGRMLDRRVGRPVTFGLLAGGALLGGGLGWWATRKKKVKKAQEVTDLQKTDFVPLAGLAKAASDDFFGNAQAIFDAGTKVEETLAERLARIFGGWAELTPDEMSARRDSLRDVFLEDLAQALTPLDTAARGGAGVPVPTAGQTAAGGPRTLSFTFDARSPYVTQAIENHRLQLAGKMADEQIETIRSVILRQAMSGASPETTAKMIRQTIGLTPIQAGHVETFRAGLEALDPRVKTRALRDRRFDRTIDKALETDTPLTTEQVDRMVDAYQRRYLALRAMTIARTEGLRAANAGHVAAIDAALREEPQYTVIKTWIATEDERTRDDHRALNGQSVVGLQTPFLTPSGDTIRWPHDDNAPARQVVRCRCTIATRLVARGTEGRFGGGLVADNPAEMVGA